MIQTYQLHFVILKELDDLIDLCQVLLIHSCLFLGLEVESPVVAKILLISFDLNEAVLLLILHWLLYFHV